MALIDDFTGEAIKPPYISVYGIRVYNKDSYEYATDGEMTFQNWHNAHKCLEDRVNDLIDKNKEHGAGKNDKRPYPYTGG